MPTLFVMRHGEPALTGVLLGQANPPLSDHGRLRAAVTANVLAGRLVFTSPLLRALETAQFLSSDPIIVPELTEISYGDWDGLTWKQIELKWPQLARSKIESWTTVTPPGGEAWDTFRQRVRTGLAQVLTRGIDAVLVGHEAVNAVIASELMNQEIQSYKQNYCEFTEYSF